MQIWWFDDNLNWLLGVMWGAVQASFALLCCFGCAVFGWLDFWQLRDLFFFGM